MDSVEVMAALGSYSLTGENLGQMQLEWAAAVRTNIRPRLWRLCVHRSLGGLLQSVEQSTPRCFIENKNTFHLQGEQLSSGNGPGREGKPSQDWCCQDFSYTWATVVRVRVQLRSCPECPKDMWCWASSLAHVPSLYPRGGVHTSLCLLHKQVVSFPSVVFRGFLLYLGYSNWAVRAFANTLSLCVASLSLSWVLFGQKSCKFDKIKFIV